MGTATAVQRAQNAKVASSTPSAFAAGTASGSREATVRVAASDRRGELAGHYAHFMRHRYATSARRSRLVPALVVLAALMIGAAACSDSDSGSDNGSDTARTASSTDCPARFGCAKTASGFQVVNNTDVEISLEASAIVNVRSADRPSLSFSVPARTTSAKQLVILGDDGFESDRGYIPGRTEGAWTWTIRSGPSITEARIELAFSDDSSIGIRLFEARSHIGQPVATWGSAYDPVSLISTTGVKTFTAIGSRTEDFTETRPVSSWTFSAPTP